MIRTAHKNREHFGVLTLRSLMTTGSADCSADSFVLGWFFRSGFNFVSVIFVFCVTDWVTNINSVGGNCFHCVLLFCIV